jgi:hypothetical protein
MFCTGNIHFSMDKGGQKTKTVKARFLRWKNLERIRKRNWNLQVNKSEAKFITK